MKTIINRITRNPKTSLGALVILLATVLLWFGKIDGPMFLSVLGIAGAWIGFASKDGSNKTK